MVQSCRTRATSRKKGKRAFRVCCKHRLCLSITISVEDKDPSNPGKQADFLISKLRNNIQNEREKILLLKNRYTQKLDEKYEMEKLLRACINDYKHDLWEMKTDLRYKEAEDRNAVDQSNKAGGDIDPASGKPSFEDKMKDNIKDILEKEKRLSLLHDKIFFGKNRISQGQMGL